MKICCQWREKVELAIEKEELTILDETIWYWYRFGSRMVKSLTSKQDNILFDCSFCQQKVSELNKLAGVDLTNPKSVEEVNQGWIEKGTINCCRVVGLIDLQDPNKDFLYRYSQEIKLYFQKKLCLIV